MKNKIGKLKIVSVYVMSGLLFACSSAPKNAMEKEVQPDLKDYVVRERYPEQAPDWAKGFAQFKKQNENHGMNYFLGESGDVSDRIAGCDLAALSAKKRIAQQIAEFITDKIAVSKAGQLVIDKDESGTNKIGHYYKDTLAGKSVAFLSGAKEYDHYWEERDYSLSGGKKRVYQCSTLVVIDDKSLAEAVKKAATKASDTIDDQEAKSAVKEMLKDVDKEFESFMQNGPKKVTKNNQ